MPKNKILILFFHPLYEKSSANKILVKNIPYSDNFTFHDVYQEYPNFDIDIKKEQLLLSQHNIIIWQHPLYWFNCPPLMKQWIDMVFEYGWAYGKNGESLENKIIFQVITTGADKESYCETGFNQFLFPNLLYAFKQTAKVCNMRYFPPFVIHGTFKMNEKDLEKIGLVYKNLLYYLEKKTINDTEIKEYNYLNDWFLSKK
jgi:glutathione-regulated potassium-efflux system ancillary protein KefG